MTAAVTIETARADDVAESAECGAAIHTAWGRRAVRGRRTANGRASTPSEESRGAVWVLAQDRPARVPVRTGISDGRDTAILEGDLTPGTPVVTGTASTTSPAATTTPATSPLLPFGGRGGGGRRGGGR